MVLQRKSCKSLEDVLLLSKCYRCYSLLLFASSQRQLWLCESSSHLHSLRLNRKTHTLGQQANHLCSCQRFWSTSDAFWWSVFNYFCNQLVDISRTVRTLIDLCQYIVQPQIHLELLSVTFILNVRGFFIGLQQFVQTASLSLSTARSDSLWKARKPNRPTLTTKKSFETQRQRRLGRWKARRTLLTHRIEMK